MNPLFLIALGPTATVLASDLSLKGFQAIDIGHLDICYEQTISGTNCAVKGKYTNESENGHLVDDCNDEQYLSQIITRIGI